MMPSEALAIGYYLDHFTQVIEGVQAPYGFLLKASERDHLTKLKSLTSPALMLYARLVNRRGPCFRVALLVYPEIERLDLAVAELLAAGRFQSCDGELEPAALEQVLMGWTAPAPVIDVPKWLSFEHHHEGAAHMKISTIGLDLAKLWFQVHGCGAARFSRTFDHSSPAWSAWKPARPRIIGRVN